MSLKEYGTISRQRIRDCVRLKKENNNISVRELSTKLSLPPYTAKRIFSAADAWIKREQIETLIEQLNTGNLNGLDPLASLNNQQDLNNLKRTSG